MRTSILIYALFGTLTMNAQGNVASSDSAATMSPVVTADDFTALTADGKAMKLCDLPKGRLTILVFFDPDCGACRQAIFGLKHSSLVKQLIEEEVLQVMTVHVGYEERLWRNMLGDMPETWMKTTTTAEMLDGKCYDLSTMPALYLLDADRKIMMRSSYAENLTEVLYKLW